MHSNSVERFLYFCLIMAGFLLYPALNQKQQVEHIVKFPLDDWVPFLPSFSVFYLLYGPLLLLTLVYFVFIKKNFRKTATSFIFCLSVSMLIYTFYPTAIYRPSITETDIFSKTVSLIYAYDKPYNCCLPSLHVSLSILSCLHWNKILPQMKLLFGSVTFLICISTVLIRQHYMPDVISGIILSIISFYFGNLFKE